MVNYGHEGLQHLGYIEFNVGYPGEVTNMPMIISNQQIFHIS